MIFLLNMFRPLIKIVFLEYILYDKPSYIDWILVLTPSYIDWNSVLTPPYIDCEEPLHQYPRELWMSIMALNSSSAYS